MINYEKYFHKKPAKQCMCIYQYLRIDQMAGLKYFNLDVLGAYFFRYVLENTQNICYLYKRFSEVIMVCLMAKVLII